MNHTYKYLMEEFNIDPKVLDLVAEAEEVGADAVLNIRYASSAVMQGAAEVIVYGTAVKFINK